MSSFLPIKSSYKLLDKSNPYGLGIIELIDKHRIEVVEEIYYSKDSDYDNMICTKCDSSFLEIEELVSLYEFVVDLSDMLMKS